MMKKNSLEKRLTQHAMKAFLAFMMVFCFVSYGQSQNLEVDTEELANTLYNDAREEIITALQEKRQQLEDEAKNRVYQEVKRQFEAAFEDEITMTREAISNFLDRNPIINSVLNDYKEGRSQEVVTSLQELLNSAKDELNQILELNKQYEEEGEEFETEYMDRLNELGIKGRWVDKVGEWEAWYQQNAADRVALAKQLYEGFEGGQPAGQLNLMFDLIDQYSSNVPVLGRFLQLYAQVGKEMLNAAIRAGSLIRQREQGCIGEGTHSGFFDNFNLGETANATFTQAFPGETACPTSVENIFEDINDQSKLYFWTGSSFLVGESGNGGMPAIISIQAFLRLHDYADLADDLAVLQDIYNMNFPATKLNYEQLMDDFAIELRRIERVVRYFCETSVIDQLLQQYGENAFDYNTFILRKDEILDEILIDHFVHNDSGFGDAWQNMLDGYSNLWPVSQRGSVVLISPDRGRESLSGATVNITGSNTIYQACSELTTDENGTFKVLFLADENSAGEAFFRAAFEGKTSNEVERLIEADRPFLNSMTLEIEEEQEEEELTPVSVTISPVNATLKVGETQNFTAIAIFQNDSTANVTALSDWNIGGNSFTATEPGNFPVSAAYMGFEASASVTVEEEEETQCNEPNEIPDGEGGCICNEAEGYERSDLGKCVNIDEAIEEVTEEGDGLCNEEELTASLARLDELVASGNRMAAGFRGNLNKFMKEVNDQNSNPCENNIIAASYAGAKESLAEYQLLTDEATTLGTDLIFEAGLCPLEEISLDINSILQKISQLGPGLNEIQDGLAMMENQLQTFGCDEQEVADQGDTIAERGDIEITQAGGTGATETCGDGIDNDGDGLIDEDCEGLGNYNVIIVLYDSGSAADDIFGLSVSGQGNLGTTPEGGSRTYPLRLSPGSYVATVTVISAPDNRGTFTIRIFEGDREIVPPKSGVSEEGAVIDVPFTVGGNTSASAEVESILPGMMNFLRRIEQQEGGNH